MRKRDLEDKEAVQAAVRQVAEEWLEDPNITSVGIGYKITDGKRTDTLALQFTVDSKAAPEALGSRPIPEKITANGIEFDTDVVQRSFEHHPVAVAPEQKSERKRRVDPMAPGVSIGNVGVTAGTLGCLVRDAATGEVRILSNWHVLQGDTGELGDRIVQPGPYDDNRVAQNGCGRLVRSFLGLAGDCAIASVEGRRAVEEVLDLGVAVRRLGDPELGDRVVKSGRTTDVTYGIVTRIHSITKLDYGRAGEQRIGGFEIGPDDDHPAPNGEISMGGDSGSAWLAVDRDGKATDMVVGLHFAGETQEPAEYAMACCASSVFKKLEIAPLEAPGADGARIVGDGGRGYDRDFLPGHRVNPPSATRASVRKDFAPTRAGETVRHCTHFSLAMSASRRFCRWVAWNVDGARLTALSRVGLDFVLDDAYDPAFQVGDELYGRPANALDRGHIARRADLVWGPREEAQRANADSFKFTNITPQLDDFNQSRLHGLWGELENAIFEDVDVEDVRLSVMGGPIFKDTDFPYRGVLVPRSFWKVIAYVEGGELRAKAFVLTQDDLETRLEAFGLEPFKLYQVTLRDLTSRTGLAFRSLARADTMRAAPEALGEPVRRIEARSEVAG
ncbi:MAG: DNA/RNA non-specific endonuclease [Solirubrobacterales bacterium]|nr:DNA/RNA non-specific endonuclease [Solirubrobacterales bacterium]